MSGSGIGFRNWCTSSDLRMLESFAGTDDSADGFPLLMISTPLLDIFFSERWSAFFTGTESEGKEEGAAKIFVGFFDLLSFYVEKKEEKQYTYKCSVKYKTLKQNLFNCFL